MSWYEEVGQTLSRAIARLDAIQRRRGCENSYITCTDDPQWVGPLPISQQTDQGRQCSDGVVE